MAELSLKAQPLHAGQGAAVVGLAEEGHLVPVAGQGCCQVAELAWEIKVEK